MSDNHDTEAEIFGSLIDSAFAKADIALTEKQLENAKKNNSVNIYCERGMFLTLVRENLSENEFLLRIGLTKFDQYGNKAVVDTDDMPKIIVLTEKSGDSLRLAEFGAEGWHVTSAHMPEHDRKVLALVEKYWRRRNYSDAKLRWNFGDMYNSPTSHYKMLARNARHNIRNVGKEDFQPLPCDANLQNFLYAKMMRSENDRLARENFNQFMLASGSNK